MRVGDFSKEKFHVTIARLKKGGRNFEINIDPDLAIAYRQGKNIDVTDILKSEDIYEDVKDGLRTSEQAMKSIFGTDDPIKVAEIILKQGEIQLTKKFKDKIREEKRKKIIELIHTNGVDPRTNLVHPVQRIENAIEEAKIKIDENLSPEEQVQDIVKKLQAVLPIKMERKEIFLKIPPQHAPKCINVIRQHATVKMENWTTDGHYTCTIEMPAGMVEELFDKLNHMTHGSVESRIEK